MRQLNWRVNGAVRLAAAAALIAAFTGCEKKSDGGEWKPSYVISGTVSGAATAGVTVRIQGGPQTTTTDLQGRYSLRVYDGTYTVEASLAGFTFTPPTRAVTVNGADVPDQDFTSKLGGNLISGVVSGAVTAGVTVRIQGGTQTTTTDVLGRYSLRVDAGTHTVEPSLEGYTFTPATRDVTVNGVDVPGQDFVSKLGISIAGKVTGDGRQGVTITVTGPAPATTTRTVTTGADGQFQLTNVEAGAYLVTPSRAGGWTFSPANTLVTVDTTSVTGANFASTAATRRLSGKLTGAITSGVFVTLSGAADAVVVTDGSGNFAFTELAPGDYVVTPAHAGFAFTPASRSAKVASVDVTGQDFAAAATHKIAGRISGDVLAGVSVSLSGKASGTATSDASGYYEFSGLVDGSYVVTPSLDGYELSPASRPVTLAGADVTGANFTTSAQVPPASYTVSGSVSGATLARVTITLQDAASAVAAVTVTDATGAFTIPGVPPGDYLIIPAQDDYTFDPASRLVAVRTASVTGQTFTATVKPTARTIAGIVDGAATAGVTVTLVGPSPATTAVTVTTDANGSFAFRGLADGLYLATPSLSGLAFTPANCLVTVAGPSVSNVRFTSRVAPHSISGKVSGAVTAGVTVALSGPATAEALTASDGSFTFDGLADGTYTVTPALAGYYFSPMDAEVTVDGADVTGVEFVSAPTRSISGYVSGAVLDGVKVNLIGAATAEATTDVTGFYAFTGLRDGGYVLTPSLDGYTFDPQVLPVDVAGADVTTANFVATLVPTYTVAGTITGPVVSGVTLELSGEASGTTTTDDGGLYLFTGLRNGSYMVIPSIGGYTFAPASRAFRIDDGDVTGQDFTSAAAP